MSAIWTENPVDAPIFLRELDVRVSVFERVTGGAYSRSETASPRTVLIFGRNGFWRTRAAANEVLEASAFSVGSTTRPIMVESDCVDGCVEVSMPPWIAIRLMPGLSHAHGAPTPVQDLLPIGAQLADLAGDARCLKRAGERIARSISETVAQLDGNGLRADIEWAWRRIARAGGAVRMKALAENVGLSERQFRARFQQESGLTPKMAARLYRFQAVMQSLGSAAPLAEIAFACGYADQSHMNRDFAAFAGAAPREIRERTEKVQVIPAPV